MDALVDPEAIQPNIEGTGKVNKSLADEDDCTLCFCKYWNKWESQRQLVSFASLLSSKETRYLYDFIPSERIHQHPMVHFGNRQEPS